MTQESEYFPGQQLNVVGVRDLAAQSQQPATATPERWFANNVGQRPDGTFDLVPFQIVAFDPEDPPEEDTPRWICEMPSGHDTDARLICAAVNATREAGYGTDMLEAGCLLRDVAQRDRLLESEAHFHAAWSREEEAHLTTKAALAECREALRVLAEHASEMYPHFESERGQREIAAARALLARLDTKE